MHWCQKWHQGSKGAFSAYFLPQNTENKERYNLECSYVVPGVNSCGCMNVHCPVYIHFIPPFFNEKMSPEKLEFFAQFTATMIYNEDHSGVN